METDRVYAVLSKLMEYVKSPSLAHIRGHHQLQKLAKEIVEAVDRTGSVWKKWSNAREHLAKAASPCWIPDEDLQEQLNLLPGSFLTLTDVRQRLRALWEEPWSAYPDEDFRNSCLALYAAEKGQGTELIAIIGAIREHIEREEVRLRQEREEAYRKFREDEQLKRRQRFSMGADVGWIDLGTSDGLYCRRNGRTFRIVAGKDKRWKLFRIATPEDVGELMGSYSNRTEANTALGKIAYAPEQDR